MSNVNSKGGTLALVIGHMAGMIDLGALPIWVGAMISGYGFAPSLAGGLVSLFLIAVVIVSVFMAPLFHKLNVRWLAPLGFWVSAAAFYAMTLRDDVMYLAILHAVAGLGTGVAISCVHGTMGKTSNPHRVFAMGATMLGIGMAVFLGVTPGLIERTDASAVFLALSVVMAIAAVIGTLAFPSAHQDEHHLEVPRFEPAIWFAILGIMCMALVQAMVFSFVERIGDDLAIPTAQLATIFVFVGLMNIIPPILAGLLENKLVPLVVGICGALVQAVLAYVVTNAAGLTQFVLPVLFMPFIILFTHVFVFGFLARNETTGRAAAATPAMIMTGSASAPFLGGVLVQVGGYPALGAVAAGVSIFAVVLFAMARRAASRRQLSTA
ncbi:MAG: MFS transporter [Pseudomonadota bacterium]